ncbi:hypothetical protein F5Y13DRAFT_81200 [Hypoxylon sp. FL1857]|nr:hypothetical protein F5Y13DRAFT_81200 [Hypoxylon sp. FL1857]
MSNIAFLSRLWMASLASLAQICSACLMLTVISDPSKCICRSGRPDFGRQCEWTSPLIVKTRTSGYSDSCTRSKPANRNHCFETGGSQPYGYYGPHGGLMAMQCYSSAAVR